MTIAFNRCCHERHPNGERSSGVPDWRIVDVVKDRIDYCDFWAGYYSRGTYRGWGENSARFAAAADKLRDFATVELLCADLGITRKELSND